MTRIILGASIITVCFITYISLKFDNVYCSNFFAFLQSIFQLVIWVENRKKEGENLTFMNSHNHCLIKQDSLFVNFVMRELFVFILLIGYRFYHYLESHDCEMFAYNDRLWLTWLLDSLMCRIVIVCWFVERVENIYL